MENAEEVMQLLEQFSKIKPKEIPRELEDYLGYVAKTGDPVYQWSLIKCLFREKLLSVITDFYESTLTVELPPCPNVEPFNYERMKTSLLERFDSFTGAPFTVQRICELLTNPRKEYNRADKYMRAIEKNILVVSTREPGTGKRPLECDGQSETVLNGIPDVKLNESDSNLLHVPTDLPYLGAPPASNDVTIETTEPNSTINSEKVGLDGNEETKKLKTEPSDKSWSSDEPTPSLTQDVDQSNSKSEILKDDILLNTDKKQSEENDCDTNNSLSNINSTNPSISTAHFEGESSSDVFSQSSENVLPDSIESSDSPQECREIVPKSKIENDETGSVSDENEVSSSPADETLDIPLIQEEIEESKEKVVTDSCLVQEAESSLPEVEVNSSERVIETDEDKKVAISEVTVTKSGDVDLECSEITGTVDSPISPGDGGSLPTDAPAEKSISVSVLEESEQPDSHPDSSNDVCIQSHSTSVESVQQDLGLGSEADSMSETNEEQCEESRKDQLVEDSPDQSNTGNEMHVLEDTSSTTEVSSPSISKVTEECLEKTVEESAPSSLLLEEEEAVVSEGQCSNHLIEDTIKIAEVQSTSDIPEEMCDQERREESVIQSVPNNVPDSQQHISIIEEISVDPSCDAEEEAMDIDDTSNQMTISEGENEVEPMDQSDQLQS